MKIIKGISCCESCETEITEIGCDCGDYEPGFDKVADHVERRTGYILER